jgi:hypothetical protein
MMRKKKKSNRLNALSLKKRKKQILRKAGPPPRKEMTQNNPRLKTPQPPNRRVRKTKMVRLLKNKI